MAKSVEAHRKWAIIGAQARLREVQAEIAEIFHAFPELRGQRAPRAEGGSSKRKFSPKGKKAISDGMRKYWARRKAMATKAASR